MALRVCLVVYDNDSFINFFPLGTAYVAGSLRAKGHQVTIWSQDIHHYPDEALTVFLDANDFDVVGIGVIAGYYQYAKLLKLSEAVNRAKRRPFFVLGGYGPTPEPEYFLRKTGADAIVLGEGEQAACDLMDAIENKTPLAQVKSVAFMDGDRCVVNERLPLIENIDTIPWPAYDLFDMNVYRLYQMPGAARSDFGVLMLSGRGCTFKCTFCYRMDTGHRPRAPEAILDEVEYVQKQFGITYVDFCDDLLMVSKPRTVEFCEAILKRGTKFKWSCNGRLNYASPEVLDIMKRAGSSFINYGIESVDEIVLRNMKKGLRYEQIITGVENTLAAGIHPGLNIIFGNIGDNRETLQKSVDFLLRYDDQGQFRTIRPVTPYPGSPLYYDAIQKGLLEGPEDFYERKHLNSDLVAVNFTTLTDAEFYEALYDANAQLVHNYYSRGEARVMENYRRLYRDKDTSFRGVRHM